MLVGLLIILLICAVVSIACCMRRRSWGRPPKESFPPGPFAWPVTGHMHLFSPQALRDASTKYGPILGLRFGCHRAVVVSSPELAKLLLLTHDKLFSDRHPFEFTSILLFRASSNGIAFSSPGPKWRHHRKLCTLNLFTAKRLRELQPVLQQAVRNLLLSIHHHSSAGTAAIDLGRCVGQMSSQLMMCLLQSRASLQVGGEDLQLLIRDEEWEMYPTLGDFLPFLSWLDIFQKRRMRRVHARLDKVYTEMLMERKESTAPHDDLLQALLSEKEEPLSAVEIKAILSEMVGAGTHTTALTLEWVMAELLKKPGCLHRLQREIDTQLGPETKYVTSADLPKLSYLKCVIKEASRLHPLLPLLIPRLSTEECKVQGYTIPAKTLLYVNVWAIQRDERVWPNANEFIPERFEGKDIDLKGQHFELLPFGSGRRSCLGLPLALPVVETTVANLVRCFDWELPEGETVNMDESFRFALNRASPLIAIPKRRVSAPELPDIF